MRKRALTLPADQRFGMWQERRVRWRAVWCRSCLVKCSARECARACDTMRRARSAARPSQAALKSRLWRQQAVAGCVADTWNAGAGCESRAHPHISRCSMLRSLRATALLVAKLACVAHPRSLPPSVCPRARSQDGCQALRQRRSMRYRLSYGGISRACLAASLLPPCVLFLPRLQLSRCHRNKCSQPKP